MVFLGGRIKDGEYHPHLRLVGTSTNNTFNRTHIQNIVHLPSGEKFSIDVAFGGDGPTNPLPMTNSGAPIHNLGAQQVRLVHEAIPKQQLHAPKLWIFQYRNGADRDWNSFYSFAEVEFFQEDFEVMNMWGSARTLHRWTVLVVRFLRKGEEVMFGEGVLEESEDGEVDVVGKVMLVNNVVKVNLGGRTSIVETLDSEEARVKALRVCFGIQLTKEQEESIDGWDTALKK